MNYQHNDPWCCLSQCQTEKPIEDLQVHVQLLCGYIRHLQQHCIHLEERIKTLESGATS